MAPQVSRIRSASILPGVGQTMMAALPVAGSSPPGSPGSPGSPNAFQYNIPGNTPTASGWAGAYQQAHAFNTYRDRGHADDGQRVLFGNEAIVFVAERFEMFKAIMTLLGTASGATTRTSTRRSAAKEVRQPPRLMGAPCIPRSRHRQDLYRLPRIR